MEDPLLAIWSAEQQRLAKLVEEQDRHQMDLEKAMRTTEGGPLLIGGVDLSFCPHDPKTAYVGLALFKTNGYDGQGQMRLEVLTVQTERVQLAQPYVPGFLAFREAPHIIALVERVLREHPEWRPDCLLVDGNGVFHPAGLGIASYLGVVLDLPTIGVAKTLFYHDGLTEERLKIARTNLPDRPPHGPPTIDTVPLKGDSGRVWGMALYGLGQSTKKPVYVSVGHRCSLPTAVELVRALSFYRIPEPIRIADQRTREVIRKIELKH